MIEATFFRHHFYAYPETEMAQCQGYAGLHLQLGGLAMGLLPRNWKDRGGVSAYLGVFVPRGSQRRLLRGWLKLWPKGGPNGEIAKRQRAQRTRDPNFGYSPTASAAPGNVSAQDASE